MAPKKTKNPLEVKPVSGEAFRYYVTSERNPETQYLVDVESYWGNGWCDCPDFRVKCEPFLSRGRKNFVGVARCKHILAAREFAAYEQLDLVLTMRRKFFEKLKKENKTRSLDIG